MRRCLCAWPRVASANHALDLPQQEMLARDGIDLVANSPAEAATLVASEVQKWGTLVKELNLRAE